MEERFEALQETWAGYAIEFPTYPKALVHGREESQRILYLCSQAETNPMQFCLSLFGNQILVRRVQQGDGSDELSGARFIFVYGASGTPAALADVLAPYEGRIAAPIVLANRDTVVESARCVKAALSQGTAFATDAETNPAVEQLDSVTDPAAAEDGVFQGSDLPQIIVINDGGDPTVAVVRPQDYRADYACRYVLTHFQENINRDNMAKMVSLSPGYFSNLFRSEVGMSFSDYLIQVRVENAKRLLRRFDLSVEEISKRCGFNSLAHFSRTFKDRCGVPPLRYRKNPPTTN